ncbi:TPA: helix-turn-helix transcriptional regulator, partial [Streptococcus equi subsp. zooepidemicus]|nr:helix-turn-helix transcriptional regulator [Streptococcus equi subsp. zooepidemicus]
MNGIGFVIKKLRIQKGLTQKNIYHNLCSRKQLSRIENNISYPSIYLLYNICQKLDVSMDEVIHLTIEDTN